MSEQVGVRIVDPELDRRVESTPVPVNERLSKLIAAQTDLNETGISVLQDVHEDTIAAIGDALVLANERIGDRQTFTRAELLTAIGWAAHVGAVSAQSFDGMSPGVRRQAAGNFADGRDSCATTYEPVPLFAVEGDVS